MVAEPQYLQEPPFAVQIELTEGCPLRCTFCGLNGIRGKENDYKFMKIELAGRVANLIKEAGWKPRIEFAMHGEPSVNPHMLEILDLFRERLPKGTQLMMTSNGAGFMADPTYTIDEALRHLNVLALDWYENVKIVPKILERYKGKHKGKIIRYPENPDGNPHRRRKPGEHDFVVVQDIQVATKGTHSVLNNHAGCGAPKNFSQRGKRCAKPFRELAVRWDGHVAICCNDWRGIFKCGNLSHSTLEEVWNGPAFQAARRKLYHGQRDFGPCDGCDAVSYRVGLLPDKYGKVSLPEPTQEDRKIINKAIHGSSYALPVLREWEVSNES